MSLFRDCLAEQTLRLVQIASVTKDEKQICDQMLDWVESTFPGGPRERVRDGFWMAPKAIQEGAPTVALVGHLDTVPPAQTQRYAIEEGLVYGLGACDMKGGVAVMMHLLAWFAQLEPAPLNVVGIFYDREEGPYADNGLEPLMELLPPVDLAVVLEPTCNRIQAGCVGSLHALAHLRGRRAHSARPWQGDNAYYKLIPLLERLRDYPRREVQIGGLSFFEVMSATQLHTQNPANAVPEEVTVNVNYRFAPGRSREQAWSDVTELLGDLASLELREFAPAGGVQLDQPHLARWRSELQLETEAKQAWTDVARFSQAGIAAINFGPGDPAQAHQADEFVAVTALQECYYRLQRLLSLK